MKKLVVIGLLVSANAWATPNGQLLASQCFQCHGPGGNSSGEIDSLAGESAAEIYEELKEFQTETKNGVLKNGIMNKQARLYTDNEMWEIANYIATLPSTGGHDE